MIKIKFIGIRPLPEFYESIGSPDFLSGGSYDEEMKKNIIDYLNSGKVVYSMLEAFECKFGCSGKDVILYDNLITDGTWLWPAELIHYVSEHDFEVPISFLNHMKNNEFRVRFPGELVETIRGMSVDSFLDKKSVEVSYRLWDEWLEYKGQKEFLESERVGLVRKPAKSPSAGDLDFKDLFF